MAKQKIYVEEKYVYEYEVDTEEIDIEDFIRTNHPAVSIGAEFGYIPGSVQYMVEDSEWTEIYGIFGEEE